jgi:hypothetical protein
VFHPEQFRGVPPARSAQQTPTPLGHQLPPPSVVRRSLNEYDQLYGVAVSEVAA